MYRVQVSSSFRLSSYFYLYFRVCSIYLLIQQTLVEWATLLRFPWARHSSPCGEKQTWAESVQWRHTTAERWNRWGEGRRLRAAFRYAQPMGAQEACPAAERRSARAPTQHTFRWRWSIKGSRSADREQCLNSRFRGVSSGGTGYPRSAASTSIGGNYSSVTPPPSIATIDARQLHAFRFDDLSPVHQDGKCAH